MRIGKSLALGAAGLTSFLVLWEGIVQAGFVSQAFLPAPSQIPAALLREIRSGFWISSIYASLGHYLAGLAVGSILGIGLGVVTGLSHPSEAFLAWVVRLLRPIPDWPGRPSQSSGSACPLRRRCSSSPSACSGSATSPRSAPSGPSTAISSRWRMRMASGRLSPSW